MTEEEIKLKYGISEWNTYNLNFWSIPKCASTAIKASLLNKDVSDSYEINSNLHSTEVQKFITINQALSNNNLNFTVIRDPFERVISMYKDFGLRRPIKKHKKINLQNFNYFLDNVILKSKDETCNPHFRSMSYYIQPFGQLLVDKVLNLDNIKDFLKDYNLSFSPVNLTKPLDFKLTEEHKEKIKQRYEKDFDLLKYL